jgi:hypothetical protein
LKLEVAMFFMVSDANGPASPKKDGTFFGAKVAGRTVKRHDRHR